MEFSRQEYWSGCHSLLQGIFLTQGLNLHLLHCRQILYRLHLWAAGTHHKYCDNPLIAPLPWLLCESVVYIVVASGARLPRFVSSRYQLFTSCVTLGKVTYFLCASVSSSVNRDDINNYTTDSMEGLCRWNELIIKGTSSQQIAGREFDVSVTAVAVVVHGRSVMSDPSASPQAVARQASLSIGFSRQEYWVTISSSRGSSRLKDRTRISYLCCIARRFFPAEPPGNPVVVVIIIFILC